MTKRLSAVLITLVLLCACLPLGAVSVSAEEITGTYDWLTYSIENNEVTITDCHENAVGRVTIPAEIEGYPVVSIGSAFSGCKYLSEVVIPEGVKGIGMYAFSGCENLSNVVIPEGVTTIGEWAFQWCKKLTSIVLPDSVETISKEAFYGCSKLASVRFPDRPMNLGSDILGFTAYYQDENNWTDGVLYVGTHLLEVNPSVSGTYLVRTDTQSIAAEAFEGCSKLEEVAIPDGLTRIGYRSFADCTSLTKVIIPDSVTVIFREAFMGCSELADIQIPDSVVSLGWKAFTDTAYYNNPANWQDDVLYLDDCLLEAKKDISGTCTIQNGTRVIQEEAFKKCLKLTSVVIPDSVIQIDYDAFYGCAWLSSIILPDSAITIKNDAFYGTAYYNDKNNWAGGMLYIGNHLIEGESDALYTVREGTVTIAEYAFLSKYVSRRGNLQQVTIPSSVIHIGDGAFCDQVNLTDVYYNGTKEQWQQITILGDNQSLFDATLHCSDDDSADYKEDDQNKNGNEDQNKNGDEDQNLIVIISIVVAVLVIASILLFLLKKKKSE